MAIFTGTSGNDTLPAPGEDNSGDDEFFGLMGEDTLDGGSGNDTLDGGYGVDSMTGGTGNDSYFMVSAIDIVVEALGGGSDTVFTTGSYALAAGTHIERLQTADPFSTAALNLTGNEGSSRISGNAGANVLRGLAGSDILEGLGGNDKLDGGVGADTMRGGLGSDIYLVDGGGDVVIEDPPFSFIDTVRSSISYTLGDNLERLQLQGGAGLNGTGNGLGNSIAGNAGANTLLGLDGADTLNGGAGTDNLDGGFGNDRLIGGLGADTLTGGGDRDLLEGGDGPDRLLGGDGDDTLSGGEGADTMLGGDGNDRLSGGGAGSNSLQGGSGADTMDGANGDTLAGGSGDDILTGFDASVFFFEAFNRGTDTVVAYFNFVLPSDFEHLQLGGLAVAGTGNVGANRITGNSSANILDGFYGADTLAGGSGSDTYIVDNIGDVVQENTFSGPGYDTVESSLSFTLHSGLDSLRLTGTRDIDGVGSDRANVLVGNDGDNSLSGMDDNDALNGGRGADVLTGGADRDDFVFSSELGGGNIDAITDFVVVHDTIKLHRAIFTEAGSTGVLAPSAFRIGDAAVDASDRIVYNAATGVISYDPDGTGATQSVQFATVASGLAMTNADFVITG